MIFSTEASIAKLSIHQVGNKLLNEPLLLSDDLFVTDDEVLDSLLLRYFITPFEKVNEIYRLSHPNTIALNEVFHFAKAIFGQPGDFHEHSRQLATQLYDISSHPKIKSGELYVVYFHNLQIEGELKDAIGIFKSETKESYLKVAAGPSTFNLSYEQQAINIKKLDKGCLIFNTEEEEGYKVAVIDQTNRNTEAVYWIDDFLKLKIRNDAYTQTNNILGVYKDFVTNKMDEVFEVTKADKIDLLNRSISYFKANDDFDFNDFSQQVIGHPAGIKEFTRFKKNYETEFDAPIDHSFSISGAAVKKQARAYKSVLKLDRNFHIYIHGNREMIEKGYDKERGMSYYKVFFNTEQ
jgi:hypothetical protein